MLRDKTKEYESNRRSSTLSYNVPDKWLQFAPVSSVIINKFVAFKTPLDFKFNNYIPENDRFNINILFSTLAKMQVDLGLCIDLTNTNHYYDKSHISRRNCTYEKLPIAGHGIPPTQSEVEAFLKICCNFHNKNPQLYIGVHCTHGFNRTGFLIVSFLVQIFKYDVKRAINEFAAARPPGIYRQNYINNLYYRYSSRKPNFQIK